MSARARRVLLALALLLPPCTAAASANVNAHYGGIRNGNLQVECTDMTTPLWLGKFMLQRVYVSTNDYTGMFGAKWELRIETYLDVRDDGSVVVHEFGGGFGTPFPPTNVAMMRKANDVYDEMTAAAERSGRFGSDAEERDYTAWLQGDDSSRHDEWTRLRDLGLVSAQQTHAGETFYSAVFGSRYITRVPEGYQREDLGGFIEAFGLSGRLERIWDANRNFITLRYNARGRLNEIDDNLGNRFVFTLDAQGFVTRIASQDGRVARFAYDSDANLVSSTDANGDVAKYGYDDEHRMTSLRYPDGKTGAATYYDTGRVKELKTSDGAVFDYVYKIADPALDATAKNAVIDAVVTGKNADGSPVNSEYTYSGPRWNVFDSYVTVVSGKRTESTLNAGGAVTAYKSSDGTTTYGYDQLGRSVLEDGPNGKIQVTYGEGSDRVTSVTKIAGGVTTTKQFAYDVKGNPLSVTDGTGHVITFAHDRYGRVTTVTDGATTFRVGFDKLFEPVSLSLGSARAGIVYKGDGDFKALEGVTSPAGAAQIAAYVRSLRTAIDPLNVTIPAAALTALDNFGKPKTK